VSPARSRPAGAGLWHSIKPNSIGFANAAGDLAGGVTAAIVALPLALAFGVASGAGPVAGIYGAICVGLFAALFGGTPTQISGPTGPMTIVSASLFTQFGDEPAIAFTVVMLTGLLQIGFGALRIGRYVNLMPYPVISGFMTGIGGILLLMQIEPLLGRSATAGGSGINGSALLIGAVAIAICFFTPRRIGRVLPSPLLALTAGTVLSLLFFDVPVLGEIPSALPSPVLPVIDVERFGDMISTALVLAALGSIDSLLTSLVADNATASFHDSDKELVGQGVGNLAAGLLGGIPGAGATIRTLTNIQAGGRTPLSGVIHALLLLAIAIGLGPVVGHIPEAALAGVLVKVGVDVIDWPFLRRVRRVPRIDLVLMIVVFLLTVFVDVITAVGVGIVLASLGLVKEAADVAMESMRILDDENDQSLLTAAEAELLRACGGAAQYVHFSGLMSFGAANDMGRRFARLGDYRVLVLDLCDVPRIDGTAGLELEVLIQRSLEERREVVMIGLSLPVARVLNQLGSLDRIKETRRFANRTEGLREALAIVAAGTPPTTPPP
jgi:SulP family sulfate permease